MLYQADGGPIGTEGQVAARIGVSKFSIRHSIVVVDCGNERTIEMDVLTHGDVRIHLTTRIVSLQGLEIPLEPEDSGECCQVSLAEGTVVRVGPGLNYGWLNH